MDVSVLIRLIDEFTGPAGRIAQSLRTIGDGANQLRDGFSQAIRQGFSVENIEQAAAKAEQALTRARGRLLGAFGTAMTLAAPVVQAGKFDQSFKGLEKVLDVSIDRLKQLRRFALDTSALVPIAARDIVDLMAEAAQGGVPQAELEGFALYVARAAVAFDMAGAEIGERFAKLRNVYKLNQAGVEDLGDATNHLSNNMAAKAREITDFANRAAGAAAIFRLSATETSAVGAAMIAAGIVPETAARGFTAMATRILSGGEDIEAAFKKLGMSRKQFMADLKEDAPAAILKLFETMAQDADGMQALIDLVGREFADDFAKMIGNPELLAQALGLVADKASYAGSATEEAAKQAEGAARRWDLLVNKLTRMAIVLGDRLLPVALDAADAIGGLIDRFADFAQQNPALASGAVQSVAALMALSIASRLLAYAFAGARVGAIQLASLFLRFDSAGKNIAIGWRLLAGAGRFLGVALALVKAGLVGLGAMFAGLTAPIWATIAAIAAAGFALWKYWDRVTSFASGFASAFGDLFGPAISAALAAVNGLIDRIGALLGIDAAGMARFREAFAKAFDFSALIDGAKSLLSDFWAWLGGFFSQEQLSGEEQAAMYDAGRAMGQALIDGIREYIAAYIKPLQDLFKFALEIEWPEPPKWLSWLIERGGAAASTTADALDVGSDAVKHWWTGEVPSPPKDTPAGVSAGPRPPPPRETVGKAQDAAAGRDKLVKQPAGVSAATGAFDRFLSGMDRAGGAAAADLEQGGRQASDALVQGAREAAGGNASAPSAAGDAGALTQGGRQAAEALTAGARAATGMQVSAPAAAAAPVSALPAEPPQPQATAPDARVELESIDLTAAAGDLQQAGQRAGAALVDGAREATGLHAAPAANEVAPPQPALVQPANGTLTDKKAGGQRQPDRTPATAARASNSPDPDVSLQAVQSSLDRLGAAAGELEHGGRQAGQSVSDGGEAAASAMRSAANAILEAAGALRGAAAGLGAAVASARRQGAAAALAGAVAGAKAGALHGGTE